MRESKTVGQAGYNSETVVLYQGDCLEVMSVIEDSSVDAIIADLPYG